MDDAQLTKRYTELLDTAVNKYKGQTFTFDYSRVSTDLSPNQVLIGRTDLKLNFRDAYTNKNHPQSLEFFLTHMIPLKTTSPAEDLQARLKQTAEHLAIPHLTKDVKMQFPTGKTHGRV